MVDVATAQSELRDSYLNGGPGTVVSGVVWLAAAVTSVRSGVAAGFAVLFLGGILIFPATLAIVRLVFHRPPPSRENPGGRTVVESIFPMMGCLLAAWLLIPSRPDAVFPLSAIGIGSHYFSFRTAYGDVTFWALGATLCLVGLGSIFAKMPGPAAVGFVVASIEMVFGFLLTRTGLTSCAATH